MGGGSKAPPQPDYTPIYQMQQATAEKAFALQEKQWDYFLQQDAKNQVVSDEVIKIALDRMEFEDTNAREDRERYETIFQPLEEQLAAEAEDYSSPWRIEKEAGEAEANIAQEFEASRKAAQDRLEMYGVDPSQTRSGALDMQARVAEAAAQAAAGNVARERTENIGRALRSEAINVGKGYPGQIAGSFNTSGGGGQQAAGTGLATTASAANTMGTPVQWNAAGQSAMGQWANLMAKSYDQQIDAYKAENAADQGSGWGDILGTVVGMGFKAWRGGVAEGGAIPDGYEAAARDAPGDIRFSDGGGYVPAEMSPSGGAIPDDVTAFVNDGGAAKINVGEFVFPKDVMEWKGQEWAQKEIIKARKAMNSGEEAPAQPQMGPPPDQMAGAIPPPGAA
jgi:hypothetical protein